MGGLGAGGGLSRAVPPLQIPLLHRAAAVAKHQLSIYGSPWTAPVWMKTSGSFVGKGTLKGQAGGKYHRAWAKYFIRYHVEDGGLGTKGDTDARPTSPSSSLQVPG